MVFNDAAFRTQQWESELQLAGDQYRMQAAQQATGALQQVGSQWSQQRNQNAQFGAQMGMQQQEMEQNAAMVNARLQLMEQERQENAIKLQSLQQLDQAKISRETTRTAELQNQAMEIQNRAREFELRKQEKMFSTFDEDRRQGMLEHFDPKTIEGMALQGMVLDVPEDGGPMRVKRDKEGAASILERIQGLRRGDRTQSEDRLWKEQDTRDRSLRLQMLERMVEEGSQQDADWALGQIRSMAGGPDRPASAGGNEPIPSTQQLTPEQQEAQSYINKFNLNIGPGGLPLYEPRIAQQIGMAMVAKKAELAQAFRAAASPSDNETVKKWSDDQIMDYLTTILRNPNDPRAMSIAASILED